MMAVTNPALNYLQADNTAPGVDYIGVTASATPFAGGPCRAIYAGSGGDITLLSPRGNSVAFVSIPAGAIIPVQAVSMTASTATGVVAIY